MLAEAAVPRHFQRRKMWRGVLVVAALAALALAAESGGYLIVSKEFDTPFFVANRNLTIKYAFHNVGEGSAYDVDVLDDTFNSEFFTLVGGAFAGHFDEIPSGENKTHTFTLLPLVPGEYRDSGASLTYKQSKDGEPIKAQSSFVGTYTILTESEYQRSYADHTSEWVIFAVLSAVATVVPLGLYYSESSQTDKHKTA